MTLVSNNNEQVAHSAGLIAYIGRTTQKKSQKSKELKTLKTIQTCRQNPQLQLVRNTLASEYVGCRACAE